MKNLGFLQHVHQEHLGQNISQISWLNFNQQIWMTGTVIAVITLRMHFTRTIINQLVEQQFMSSLVSRTFRFFTIFILQRWKNSINTIWFLGFHIIQNRCVLSFICFTVFKSQRSKMHSKLKKLNFLNHKNQKDDSIHWTLHGCMSLTEKTMFFFFFAAKRQQTGTCNYFMQIIWHCKC